MDEDPARWWRYHRLSTGPRSDRAALARGEHPQIEAAYARVQSAVLDNTPGALSMLESLATLAAGDTELAFLAASIVEDYLVEHADREYQAVVRAAQETPAFAAALRSVWIDPGDTSPAASTALRDWIPYLARKLARPVGRANGE